MKKIAILGSSGGNLYNLGGKQPTQLLQEIINQARSASIEVNAIQFVGASTPMDNLTANTKASLYTFSDGEIIKGKTNSLDNINEQTEEIDEMISKMIDRGEIEGLVLMSCDPKGINKKSIRSACEKKIPIVGTGGTSMADVQNMGGNVIAVSGTTGTTNRTRAISAITSLSKNFGLKYRPVIGGSSTDDDQGSLKDRISVRGIMMASLPGFIAMAIVLALSKIPILSGLSELFDLLIAALPIMVASVAAYQVSGLGEVGVISGIIAGALSAEGGLIGGIVGGILAGVFAHYLIQKAFEFKFPGTTANIIAGGLSGLFAGLLVFFLLSPVTLFLGNSIRDLIQAAIDFNPILAGAIAGALIWPSIMSGVYHAAILPIVLLEMESTGMSFLGAIDMVALVMVSAGITLANVVSPVEEGDKAIALPGLFINLVFGTFVEASYPFMFANKIVFAGGVIAAAIGGTLVGTFGIQGTAYVPSLVAPGLSNNTIGFIISMAVAMGLAFLFTLIGNKMMRRKSK